MDNKRLHDEIASYFSEMQLANHTKTCDSNVYIKPCKSGTEVPPADLRAFYSSLARSPEPEVAIFADGLKHNASFLPKNYKIIDSNIGYCFPNETIIKSYSKVLPGQGFIPRINGFINKDDDSVKSFGRHIINRIKDSDGSECVYYVLGKRGSGKTSFIDYVSALCSDKFDKDKIIISKIYYEDYSSSILSDVNEQDVVNLIKKHLYLYLLSKKYISDFVTKSEGKDNFENFYMNNIANKIVDYEFEDIVQRILPFLMNATSFIAELNDGEYKDAIKIKKSFINDVQDIDIKIIDIFMEFLSRQKISFVVIIDGLDELSVLQTERGKFKTFFNIIADTVIKGTTTSGGAFEYIHYVLTLRNCTHAKFVENRAEKSSLTHRNYILAQICPPDPKSILRRGIMYFLLKHKHFEMALEMITSEDPNKNNIIDEFVAELLDRIVIAFDKNNEVDLLKLFNWNCRNLLWFFCDLLEVGLTTLVIKFSFRQRLDAVTIIREFFELRRWMMEIHDYNIIEIFVAGISLGFNNYYDINFSNKKVEGETIFNTYVTEKEKIGYVDNIFFNAVLPIKSKPQAFLLKVHILGLTHSYLSKSELNRHLLLLGYSKELLEIILTTILDVMIDSGVMKVKRDNGEIVYSTTNKGKYLYDHLLGDLIYLERVALASRFPDPFNTYINNICKNPNEIFEWILVSLKNVYILLIHCENVERCISRHKKDSELLEKSLVVKRIRKKVAVTVKNILNVEKRSWPDDYSEKILNSLRSIKGSIAKRSEKNACEFIGSNEK